jgi:hypothetical protein
MVLIANLHDEAIHDHVKEFCDSRGGEIINLKRFRVLFVCKLLPL